MLALPIAHQFQVTVYGVTVCLYSLSEPNAVGKPKCGSRRKSDLGAQGGSTKGSARNNARGGSMPYAKRAWRTHALLSSETLKYRVEEMHPIWPFWKHRGPNMRLVEVQHGNFRPGAPFSQNLVFWAFYRFFYQTCCVGEKIILIEKFAGKLM